VGAGVRRGGRLACVIGAQGAALKRAVGRANGQEKKGK
jgi:hypothetical protein